MSEPLPNFFLADLPSGDSLTPAIVTEACQTLKRNRERYLAERNTASIVRMISSVASNWLDSEYPFRKQALAEGPAATGFSSKTLAQGLDTYFGSITADRLMVGRARTLMACAVNILSYWISASPASAGRMPVES